MTKRIILSAQAELNLTAWKQAVGNLEYSGLGEIRIDGDDFIVEDVYLMDVGTPGFTDITSDRIMMLPPSDKRKLWFHRHPIGAGDAGPSNWSGRDQQTSTQEPLGSLPQLVKWSIAIVSTPGGWTGRIDFHRDTGTKTIYVDVEPRLASPKVVAKARKLITPTLIDYINELKDEFSLRHPEGGLFSEGSRWEDIDEVCNKKGAYEDMKFDILTELDRRDVHDPIFVKIAKVIGF